MTGGTPRDLAAELDAALSRRWPLGNEGNDRFEAQAIRKLAYLEKILAWSQPEATEQVIERIDRMTEAAEAEQADQ